MKLDQIVKLGALGLASLLPVKSEGVIATHFNFTPDRSMTTPNPLFGLASTSDKYLLSGNVETGEIPIFFTESDLHTYAFDNPFTVKDSASFNDEYTFQLDTSGNIRKVNTTTGATDSSFGVVSTGTNNTFGIAYDSNANTIRLAEFDGANMKFGSYDLGTSTLTYSDGFGFDSGQKGTPTGLGFAYKDGYERMLVGTMDGIFNEEFQNFVLDMDFDSGEIGQYTTIPSTISKLQDVHYLDGQLALAFQSGSFGGIQVMDNFSAIPEPKHYALGAGMAALLGVGASRLMRNRRKEQFSPKSDYQ